MNLMNIDLTNSKFGKRLPPIIAQKGKLLYSVPRYIAQVINSRIGYRFYGDSYIQNILFIAGLPKSGTTWLKKMLTCYPGFQEVMLPGAVSFEQSNQGSHQYQLPKNVFSRFENNLVVMKLHLPGSPNNVRILNTARIKYVILYRDLRDVAVSHYYYVSNSPWHPEYSCYKHKTVQEGLLYFADTLLCPFEEWIRTWSRNHNPVRSIVFTYEQLLGNTPLTLTQIAEHFDLNYSKNVINAIVESTAFSKLSQGRSRGVENQKSFFRKGESGDWRNHFTDSISKCYKEKVGQFLIDFGYEKDLNW